MTIQQSCPDEEIIAAYLEHRLDSVRCEKFESHLCNCPNCRETVATAGTISHRLTRSQSLQMTSEKRIQAAIVEVKNVQNSSPKAGDQIRGKIERYLFDGFDSIAGWFHQPATAVRGEGEGVKESFKKRISSVGATVQIDKTSSGGFILRLFQDNLPDHCTMRVTIKQGGRELFSTLMKQDSLVSNNIQPGHYSIEFRRSDNKSGAYHFEIKE